ncbi:hypothetical protein [Haloarchaeobius salinus]|uniref:hypothetical protein n=1 Tax=Haloarchaeobius salinus TaxID=1198298 RepID=UPI00210A64B5|nr:hypothetical protein [Haloarchaeobius salinus]
MLQNGKCSTCRKLRSDGLALLPDDFELPEAVNTDSGEFGVNSRYVVARQSHLLRSDEIIVVSRESESVVERHKIGMLAKITGGRL